MASGAGLAGGWGGLAQPASAKTRPGRAAARRGSRFITVFIIYGAGRVIPAGFSPRAGAGKVPG